MSRPCTINLYGDGIFYLSKTKNGEKEEISYEKVVCGRSYSK